MAVLLFKLLVEHRFLMKLAVLTASAQNDGGNPDRITRRYAISLALPFPSKSYCSGCSLSYPIAWDYKGPFNVV